jgi:hypothetical protein
MIWLIVSSSYYAAAYVPLDRLITMFSSYCWSMVNMWPQSCYYGSWSFKTIGRINSSESPAVGLWITSWSCEFGRGAHMVPSASLTSCKNNACPAEMVHNTPCMFYQAQMLTLSGPHTQLWSILVLKKLQYPYDYLSYRLHPPDNILKRLWSFGNCTEVKWQTTQPDTENSSIYQGCRQLPSHPYIWGQEHTSCSKCVLF